MQTTMSPWPPPDPEIRAVFEEMWADGSWGRYNGPHHERLTAALAEMHGVEHVMPCCSGTFAVELALRSLGISADDEVLLAGYDFPGNFRSIEAVGARPVLVDISPNTWCLDAAQVEAAASPVTKAILVSHLHGGCAPMREICDLAARRGWSVVEDACQATGARVDGRVAGTWGDVGVLSFGGSKLLTAGRGGALITRRADILQRAKVFCERGNHAFPLSELQAAVLLPQVAKLGPRNAHRLANVRRLIAATKDIPALSPVRLPNVNSSPEPAIHQPSFYKLAWLWDAAACADRSREQFIAAMQGQGISMDAGFRGFAGRSSHRCRKPGPLVHSERAASSTVILHHPILLETAETIECLATTIVQTIRQWTNSCSPG